MKHLSNTMYAVISIITFICAITVNNTYSMDYPQVKRQIMLSLQESNTDRALELIRQFDREVMRNDLFYEALQLAITNKLDIIVQALLEKLVEVECEEKLVSITGLVTPLFFASIQGVLAQSSGSNISELYRAYRIVVLFLERKCQLDLDNPMEKSVAKILLSVAQDENLDASDQKLIAYYWSLNKSNEDLKQEIQRLLCNKNFSELKKILNARDIFGHTLLAWTVKLYDYDMVSYLLSIRENLVDKDFVFVFRNQENQSLFDIINYWMSFYRQYEKYDKVYEYAKVYTKLLGCFDRDVHNMFDYKLR